MEKGSNYFCSVQSYMFAAQSRSLNVGSISSHFWVSKFKIFFEVKPHQSKICSAVPVVDPVIGIKSVLSCFRLSVIWSSVTGHPL